MWAAASVAACTEVVDSVVDSRYGEYNRQTDWAKNEAILLNIVRASKYQPLNFMSFQPYTGQATVSAAASSPAFVVGPDRVASQKQYSFASGALTGSATANGTISVTMLDTQNFYQAVLDPVDFTDLNTFQEQGYPRELLFRLFTNYVTLRPVNPQVLRRYAFIIYNDPSQQNQCAILPREIVSQLYGPAPQDFQTRICFSDLVEFALLSGLSSETRSAPNTGASQAKGNNGANANQNQNQNQTQNQSQNSSSQQPQTQGRLCFDPALANRYQVEYSAHEVANIQSGQTTDWTIPTLKIFMNAIQYAQYHPVCGLTTGLDQWPQQTTKPTSGGSVNNPKNKPKSPQPAAAASPQSPGGAPPPGVAILNVVVPKVTGSPVWDIHTLGPDTVELGTRSTFAIYNFLGRLLSAPESPAPGMNSNKLIGSDADDQDRYILTVNSGLDHGCFVSVVLDFGRYCVPNDGAENTKRTFSILSQLLALKTTTGDLQLTPTLRLIP
jgi:hypothetical protein